VSEQLTDDELRAVREMLKHDITILYLAGREEQRRAGLHGTQSLAAKKTSSVDKEMS
jgi:hypothetical protein